MKPGPNAINRALMIAKQIGERIDPGFGNVDFPKVGGGVPLMRAGGGGAGSQIDYSQPDSYTNMYSKAAQIASQLPMERATPDEWKGALLNRGVRPAEIKWSEFEHRYPGDEPISREDVAKHFDVWRPNLYETDLRGPETKYEQWTMPGGKNYREVLLHEPEPSTVRHQHSHWMEVGSNDDPWADDEPEDIPNVYVHARLKDRETPSGKKVLHAEELQSDWGQEGRKKKDGTGGFRDPDPSKVPQDTEARERYHNYIRDLSQRMGYGFDPAMPTHSSYDVAHKAGELETLFEHGRAAMAEDKANRRRMNAPIEGPYVGNTEDWVDLGLKHLLSHAAANGHDHLAWTPGDIQAQHYREEDEAKNVARAAGMRKFYDEILPKRLLKLARMHDPDARLSNVGVSTRRAWNGPHSEHTYENLPSLAITPKMRESILKHGFPAYAEGGAVGGDNDHPLTNPVYHGVKGESVSSPIAQGLNMEMFDANHPALNYNATNVTALGLGPHVARDPNIAGDYRFTTGESHLINSPFTRIGSKAQGKVMLLNTLPDEKFLPVPQEFNDYGDPKRHRDYDDVAVHNLVYSDVLRHNPKLAYEVLTEHGYDPDTAREYVKSFGKDKPFSDPWTGSGGYPYQNISDFLNSNTTLRPGKRVINKVLKDFRKRMRDRGYAGLSYINTDKDETSQNTNPTQQVEDKKCYIVFPQRDKETGWYPMRLKHAAYDPRQKGSPVLTRADGGETDAPPSAYFEVAPGHTYDPAQQQSWEQLHPQAKAAISSKMIGEYLSRWQRQTGIQGEVRPGLGGYEGNSNPNYTFHPYDPQHIQPALHGLGQLFRQDMMMGAHAKPFPGSIPAGIVRVNIPKGMSPEQAHAIYAQINAGTFKGDDGKDKSLAAGHSTSLENGTMDILHSSHGEATRAANKINALLKGKHVIESFPTNVSMPAHGADYASIPSHGGSPESSAPQANDSLQAEASSRLADLLAEAHRQGGGHKGPVDFGDTLAPGQPHPDVVSAMMPSTVSADKGPPKPGELRRDISPSQHSPENLSAIYTRMWKQHPASGGEDLPPEEAKDKLLDLYTKNLLGVWDRTPVGQRKTSRFWYRAAHALGNAYAEHHDIMPRAAHGIMAVLSPQNPWDKNVTQAERVMDTLKNRLDQPWTRGMSEVAYHGGKEGAGLPHDKGVQATGPHHWSDIEGKTLREVLAGPYGQKRAAMWIRAFDEAHNPTEYRAVSPTGEFLGTQMNKSGKAPDTASWNSYIPIAKAISIWHDPSLENINRQVGGNHKVREFYNNITNPNDPNVFVGDTHAVAAGEFLPHGSASKAVHHNFGTTPDFKGKQSLANEGTPWGEDDTSRSTGATGARGDYPVHAEAARRAAWARGVHPSEMQSVTWETVRTIFKNKSTPMKRAARAIWGEFADGKLSHSETMDKIIALATGGKGVKGPAWGGQSGQGLGKATVGSYVQPGVIAAEAAANKRYKAGGGSVGRALLIAKKMRYS